MTDWKYLIYGGLAGAVSRTITAPLEFYKLHLQVQGINPGVRTSSIFKDTIKRDGITGLFKGNGINMLRVVPAYATRFFVFNHLDTRFNKENNPLKSLGFGATAGIIATINTYPLDLIRSRMTAAPAGEKRYYSMYGAFNSIYQREGLLGFYRGISVSLLGISLYTGVNMTIFKKLKTQEYDSHFSNTLQGLGLGIISGTVALACSYPADVIRRRRMMEGLSGRSESIHNLINTSGVRALYWGFVPSLINVVPTTAISWAIIELCISVWKK